MADIPFYLGLGALMFLMLVAWTTGVAKIFGGRVSRTQLKIYAAICIGMVTIFSVISVLGLEQKLFGWMRAG